MGISFLSNPNSFIENPTYQLPLDLIAQGGREIQAQYDKGVQKVNEVTAQFQGLMDKIDSIPIKNEINTRLQRAKTEFDKSFSSKDFSDPEVVNSSLKLFDGLADDSVAYAVAKSKFYRDQDEIIKKMESSGKPVGTYNLMEHQQRKQKLQNATSKDIKDVEMTPYTPYVDNADILTQASKSLEADGYTTEAINGQFVIKSKTGIISPEKTNALVSFYLMGNSNFREQWNINARGTFARANPDELYKEHYSFHNTRLQTAEDQITKAKNDIADYQKLIDNKETKPDGTPKYSEQDKEAAKLKLQAVHASINEGGDLYTYKKEANDLMNGFKLEYGDWDGNPLTPVTLRTNAETGQLDPNKVENLKYQIYTNQMMSSFARWKSSTKEETTVEQSSQGKLQDDMLMEQFKSELKQKEAQNQAILEGKATTVTNPDGTTSVVPKTTSTNPDVPTPTFEKANPVNTRYTKDKFDTEYVAPLQSQIGTGKIISPSIPIRTDGTLFKGFADGAFKDAKGAWGKPEEFLLKVAADLKTLNKDPDAKDSNGLFIKDKYSGKDANDIYVAAKNTLLEGSITKHTLLTALKVREVNKAEAKLKLDENERKVSDELDAINKQLESKKVITFTNSTGKLLQFNSSDIKNLIINPDKLQEFIVKNQITDLQGIQDRSKPGDYQSIFSRQLAKNDINLPKVYNQFLDIKGQLYNRPLNQYANISKKLRKLENEAYNDDDYIGFLPSYPIRSTKAPKEYPEGSINADLRDFAHNYITSETLAKSVVSKVDGKSITEQKVNMQSKDYLFKNIANSEIQPVRVVYKRGENNEVQPTLEVTILGEGGRGKGNYLVPLNPDITQKLREKGFDFQEVDPYDKMVRKLVDAQGSYELSDQNLTIDGQPYTATAIPDPQYGFRIRLVNANTFNELKDKNTGQPLLLTSASKLIDYIKETK